MQPQDETSTQKVETSYWVGIDKDNCITSSCMELGLFIGIGILETPYAFDINCIWCFNLTIQILFQLAW